MTNPIIIFEQDALDQRPSGTLNEAYVRAHLAYLDQEIDVVHEYEDDNLIIYTGYNEDGEAWRFIQSKLIF